MLQRRPYLPQTGQHRYKTFSQEEKMKKVSRIIAIVVLVVLLVALGTLAAGAMAKANLAKKYPAPGQLVDVGGHKMHINCTGQGSPTVILAAGTADFSTTWAYVQPEVAKITRVCAYDRAGLGWSEPSTLPRTAGTTVEELHSLLVNAKIPGPYVLVGHSLGGMHMRLYTHTYPAEVAGLVQVDSLHEDQFILDPGFEKANQANARQFRPLAWLNATGLMALAPQSIPNLGLPAETYAQWQACLATSSYFETTIAELNGMDDSSAEVRDLNITSFGSIPLTVLSAGHEETVASFSAAENQKYEEVWQGLQPKLAALSSAGKQIIAEQSGHMVQFEQPSLVIDAIREMVVALRK
jgi:pimeloyl-ACP methyl ester carboxylesterase